MMPLRMLRSAHHHPRHFNLSHCVRFNKRRVGIFVSVARSVVNALLSGSSPLWCAGLSAAVRPSEAITGFRRKVLQPANGIPTTLMHSGLPVGSWGSMATPDWPSALVGLLTSQLISQALLCAAQSSEILEQLFHSPLICLPRQSGSSSNTTALLYGILPRESLDSQQSGCTHASCVLNQTDFVCEKSYRRSNSPFIQSPCCSFRQSVSKKLRWSFAP